MPGPGNGPKGIVTGKGSDSTAVVDFGQARAQKLEEKRRKTERIFFRHLISVYSVVADTAMCPIELIDVSEDGLSFQIPYDAERPWPADLHEIPIRLYFSQDTYLEILARIENSSPGIENHARYVRFGCAVDREMSWYPAYQQFVRFLHAYSEHAHKDKGDISIFYL
jgi:hypothetical protein